jgi:hypothetical protein
MLNIEDYTVLLIMTFFVLVWGGTCLTILLFKVAGMRADFIQHIMKLENAIVWLRKEIREGKKEEEMTQIFTSKDTGEEYVQENE